MILFIALHTWKLKDKKYAIKRLRWSRAYLSISKFSIYLTHGRCVLSGKLITFVGYMDIKMVGNHHLTWKSHICTMKVVYMSCYASFVYIPARKSNACCQNQFNNKSIHNRRRHGSVVLNRTIMYVFFILRCTYTLCKRLWDVRIAFII